MQRITELEERRRYLEQLIAEKEEAITRAPEGSLRVYSGAHGARVQFYHVIKQKNGTEKRVYLSPLKDWNLICALAQKSYDHSVLKSARKELQHIQWILSLNYPSRPEEAYMALPPARQPLVQPVEEPLEAFLERWQNQSYEGNPYPIEKEFYTARGERVRSKSEVEIGDYLNTYDQYYLYEFPLPVMEDGYPKIYYPDFTIMIPETRQVVLLEHLGRMDDEEYLEKNIKKRQVYMENGFYEGENIFYTWETKDKPLNRKQLDLVIGHYILKQ